MPRFTAFVGSVRVQNSESFAPAERASVGSAIWRTAAAERRELMADGDVFSCQRASEQRGPKRDARCTSHLAYSFRYLWIYGFAYKSAFDPKVGWLPIKSNRWLFLARAGFAQ